MITKEQAVKLGSWPMSGEVHFTGRHECTRTIGPRGGITEKITRCRPSGTCKTWITRPEEFRLPVKWGLYESSAITDANASDWHLAEDCQPRVIDNRTPSEGEAR